MAAAGSSTGQNQDPVKAWLQSNVPLFVRELMAGGAAGAVGKTCVAPLERTKILLMTGKSHSGAYATLRLILASEGVTGLFRGNSASCLRIVPYAAIHFSVYEFYRRLLAEHAMGPLAAPHHVATAAAAAPAPAQAPAMAGQSAPEGLRAGAGGVRPSPRVLAGNEQQGGSDPDQDLGREWDEDPDPSMAPPPVLTSSIDVSSSGAIAAAEERLAAQEAQRAEDEAEPEASSMQGLQATALQGKGGPGPETPLQAEPTGAATTHGSVESTQHPHHHHHHHQSQRRHLGPFGDLLAGSAAGATAVLMTYPLDVVRTRLAWSMDARPRGAPAAVPAAAAAAAAAGSASSSAATGAAGSAVVRPAAAGAHLVPKHHFRIVPMLGEIVRQEGVLGLYRGLAPTLYGIMPYAGLKFFVYGWLKQWYRETLASGHPTAAAASHGAADAAAAGGGRGRAHGERLPVPYMLVFGGASGLFAQTVTYPLDVIRRRMQVAGAAATTTSAAALEGSNAVCGVFNPNPSPPPFPHPRVSSTFRAPSQLPL